MVPGVWATNATAAASSSRLLGILSWPEKTRLRHPARYAVSPLPTYALRNSSFAGPSLSSTGTTLLPSLSVVALPVKTSFRSSLLTPLAFTLLLAMTIACAPALAARVDPANAKREERISFFMDGSPGLEAHADFKDGQFGIGLEPIGIEIGVIANCSAVDEVLLRLGVKVLAEVVSPGDRPVFRVARRAQRRLAVKLLGVVSARGYFGRQLVTGHRIPVPEVNAFVAGRKAGELQGNAHRELSVFSGHHDFILLVVSEVVRFIKGADELGSGEGAIAGRDLGRQRRFFAVRCADHQSLQRGSPMYGCAIGRAANAIRRQNPRFCLRQSIAIVGGDLPFATPTAVFQLSQFAALPHLPPPPEGAVATPAIVRENAIAAADGIDALRQERPYVGGIDVLD